MNAGTLLYDERTMTYNGRLGQQLGNWADMQPGGKTLHDAVFRAYLERYGVVSTHATGVLNQLVRQARLSPGRQG